MLVDVVRMRRNGKKLAWEVVQGTEPIRGKLWVDQSRREPNGTKPVSASLHGTDHRILIPIMDRVRVKIRNGQILVMGYEMYGPESRIEYIPQAWWCRPVPEQFFKELDAFESPGV